MTVLLVLYLGISVVALSAVSAQALGTTFLLDPVAAIVSALPFGKEILSPVVAIVAAVILTVAANAGLLGASRLTFNMGEHYQLPRFFYIIHPKFRTPIVALIAFAFFASFVVIASRGQLDFMADLYNFGAMLAFLSAHLSLIVMRIKKPHLKRPFKAPFNISIKGISIPLPALIGALATLSVWVLVVIEKPYGRYLGISWMLLGVCIYLYCRRKSQLKPTGRVVLQPIEVPNFHPLQIKKILVPTRGGMKMETMQMACELAKLHGAQVTALQVIEISPALPLDVDLPHRISSAELVLKRAEAIAREFGVAIHLDLIRSRSVLDTILEKANRGHCDLLILGKAGGTHHNKRLNSLVDEVAKKATCRVMVYTYNR
jgi:APA family basic amino acid/polyamine antiporter